MKKFLIALVMSLVVLSSAVAECTYEMYEAYVEETGNYEMTWAEFEIAYNNACLEYPDQCFGCDISIDDLLR